MEKLRQIIKTRPFPEYNDWWEMSAEFLDSMSKAIVTEWILINQNHHDLSILQEYVNQYVRLVYDRTVSPSIVQHFHHLNFTQPIYSGEFDALSYAYYRSAFELLSAQLPHNSPSLESARRAFTIRVGKGFFDKIHEHISLEVPGDLNSQKQLSLLRNNIQSVGEFLHKGGYMRDGFRFTFDVKTTHEGKIIEQIGSEFLLNIQQNGIGYALYEMLYPVILPSAVYLFHTMGEAQHHSSRIIEELFSRVGYEAHETDNFDPTGHPSESVIELWEIRPKRKETGYK